MEITLSNKYGTSTKSIQTDGWSWGAFFLGFIWYWVNGMWGKGILYLAVCFITSFTVIVPIVIWFFMAIKFNNEYYEFLLDNGYKKYNPNIPEPEIKAATTSYTDELEKLAALRDRGIISAEEFETKKKQILSI